MRGHLVEETTPPAHAENKSMRQTVEQLIGTRAGTLYNIQNWIKAGEIKQQPDLPIYGAERSPRHTNIPTET